MDRLASKERKVGDYLRSLKETNDNRSVISVGEQDLEKVVKRILDRNKDDGQGGGGGDGGVKL